MVAADGLRTHPAFAGAFDATQRLYFDGNSLGGIEGGALTAIAPDFDRAALGVPGMNFSTLIPRRRLRAVPHDPRGRRSQAARPHADQLARSNLLGPRRGERLRAHMTGDPLPGTPRHEVLLTPRSATTWSRTSAPRSRRGRSGRGCGTGSTLAARPTEPFEGTAARSFPFIGPAAIVFDPRPFAPANPQGTPVRADDRHDPVGGPGPARVPAPHARVARDEGPVPAHRGPAADAAVRRRRLPLQRLRRALGRGELDLGRDRERRRAAAGGPARSGARRGRPRGDRGRAEQQARDSASINAYSAAWTTWAGAPLSPAPQPRPRRALARRPPAPAGGTA